MAPSNVACAIESPTAARPPIVRPSVVDRTSDHEAVSTAMPQPADGPAESGPPPEIVSPSGMYAVTEALSCAVACVPFRPRNALAATPRLLANAEWLRPLTLPPVGLAL